VTTREELEARIEKARKAHAKAARAWSTARASVWESRARAEEAAWRELKEAEAALDEKQLCREVKAGVGALLAEVGCDCDCDHDFEGHDEACERCLACRVEAALVEAGLL
jgi:hypothetical protein